jgi:hypothetical protein
MFQGNGCVVKIKVIGYFHAYVSMATAAGIFP